MSKEPKQQQQPSQSKPQSNGAESKSAETTLDFGNPDAFLSPAVDPNIQRRALLNYGRTYGNQQVIQLLRENPHARLMIARETSGDSTMDEIKKINRYGWIAPWDESRLQTLWSSYGSSLPEVAATNWHEFELSNEGGAELDDLSIVKDTKKDFERDVKWVAEQYMAENEAMVLEEMWKIGASPVACQIVTPEMGARIQELQKIAKTVIQLQKMQEMLRTIPVGYRERFVGGHGGMVIIREVANFNPSGAPRHGPNGAEETPFASWDQVNQVHTSLMMAISGFSSSYPAIYTMLQQGEVDNLASQTTAEQAQLVVSQALGNVYENISETQPKIKSGDLDWRDLKPIHNQLYQGKKGESTRDWSGQYEQWAAKDMIGDHESAEFWTALGLGSLAAAAFILATFATGGMAAFLVGAGIGAGALQAGMSWEKYLDFAQAAETNLSKNTALVSEGQVNAALFSAILDSAFLLLDIYAPAKAAVTALRGSTNIIGEVAQQGLKKGAVEGLETVGELGSEAARPLVQKGIVEFGIEETLSKTGKNIDELLQIVGHESDEGRRLLAFKELGSNAPKGAAEVFEILPELSKKITDNQITREQADLLVQQAVEQFGPKLVLEQAGGWKKLSSTLGNGSVAGDSLEAWRKSIFEDLQEYVTKELGGDLQRTGTKGDFTNDLDISLLGPNASVNREKALSFLAGRAGSNTDNISKILYCDLFTDPRRIHIYDTLAPEIRESVAQKAAAMEQELIYSRRIFNALEAGDDEMARLIREQMQELGIKEVPFREFAETDLSALYKQMDELHNALKMATDPSVQEALALKLAKKQALINATEGGGYFSGGGVRKLVTEAEPIHGFGPDDLASKPFLAAQELTTVLDQLPKLDEEILALKALVDSGKNDAGKLASILKGIGKYGKRATDIVPEAIRTELGQSGKLVDGSNFDEFAQAFEELITAARAKASSPDSLVQQLAKDSDALVAKAQKAVRQFEAEQTVLFETMRKAAGVEGVGGGLHLTQEWTALHLKLLPLLDATTVQISAAGRTIHNLSRNRIAQSMDTGSDE
ncbi:MAG: hypothetical protein ACPG8W_06470 [Candidatus Promineifilaceae bacterium]